MMAPESNGTEVVYKMVLRPLIQRAILLIRAHASKLTDGPRERIGQDSVLRTLQEDGETKAG